MRTRFVGNSLILGVGVMLAACGGGATTTTGTPATNTVQATAAAAFTPSSLTISTGDKVTWSFASLAHNVTFDAATGVPESIPGENANTSVTRTFSTNGTFHYHCSIHPTMTGTVQVGTTITDPLVPPPPPPYPPYSRPIGQ